LEGATVTVPSLRRTVIADQAGTFILQNLPPGPLEVVMSYSGFTEERRTVVVPAGGIARADTQLLPSEITTMEAFTVESVKEGQALSLTQQRNALNIKNVTAFDEWG